MDAQNPDIRTKNNMGIRSLIVLALISFLGWVFAWLVFALAVLVATQNREWTILPFLRCGLTGGGVFTFLMIVHSTCRPISLLWSASYALIAGLVASATVWANTYLGILWLALWGADMVLGVLLSIMAEKCIRSFQGKDHHPGA